jgi:hypothetical protein
MAASISFPPLFFQQMHQYSESLSDFGVDTSSMHQAIAKIEKVFFRTQQEAMAAVSELMTNLGEITKISDVDILDTEIPGIVRQFILPMFPPASIDDISLCLAPFLRDISDRRPMSSHQHFGLPPDKGVMFANTTPPQHPSSAPAFLEPWSLDSESIQPSSKAFVFQGLPRCESGSHVAIILEKWGQALGKLKSLIADGAVGKEGELEQAVLQMFFFHGTNFHQDLLRLLAEVKDMEARQQAPEASTAPGAMEGDDSDREDQAPRVIAPPSSPDEAVHDKTS